MKKRLTMKAICLMLLLVFILDPVYCFAAEVTTQQSEETGSFLLEEETELPEELREAPPVVADGVEHISIEVDSELPEEIMETAPVIIDGVELFSIKVRVNSFYPKDRAKLARDKISQIARDHSIAAEDVQLKIRDEETLVEIIAGEFSINTVTSADAQAEGLSAVTVATNRKEKIMEAIQNYRDMRRAQNLAIQFVKAALLTSLFIMLFWLYRKGIKYCKDPAVEIKLINHYLIRIPGVRLLPLRLVQKIISIFVVFVISVLRILTIYFYLIFVLDLFPWTKSYSEQLLKFTSSFSDKAGQVISEYLPDILIIIIVMFVTNLLLKLIRFFFSQLKNETIKISGFYPEWSDTSYKLARFFLIAVSLIVIYPYIPGSNSAAFQGVSVFLGLIISFGSSSVISNIVSGFVMTYNRSFKIGDWVKIGDNMGEIIEKTMLSVHMRTTKKVDITIPNSVIISSPVINYSTSSNDPGLILHTTITMGFDVPWQTANELLIEAALATPDVLEDPKPFVLQKQLNDFSMSYEINAFTNKPGKSAVIYSNMYKNIMDVLQSAGIELLTSHHFTLHKGDIE